MVPMEKILVKGKCIIFDPKMMHPYISGSIIPILIFLNQIDKRCSEIVLIVLIALP